MPLNQDLDEHNEWTPVFLADPTTDQPDAPSQWWIVKGTEWVGPFPDAETAQDEADARISDE